ncbi:LamG-like jellyroll fold domain-containing protein [Kitasatospora sp. NPDC085895]|uniref:LamG-like jellyroll fold domain-containing protein n=1 Tax=Kitasatospora sp. NPDC085895 TaxID=3155057 RepID=UPI003450CB08
MTIDFLDIMATGLTPAYDRGMERLTLPLTAAGPGTLKPQYDFSAYRARHGRDPDAPRYLLAPRQTTAEPLGVKVSFTRAPGATEESTTVWFPAGWPAGDQAAVELPGTAAQFTAALQITRLFPVPPAPAAPEDWELTALLGTLARLLWTIGRDYQDLNRRAADVTRQRFAAHARGASLDLLGLDLGAPRFPPLRYEPDPDTLALFHLDDQPAPGESQVTEILDASGRLDPQNSTVAGTAQWGRTGRFGPAFGFTAPGGHITVTDLPALGADLTIEAVVRPDRAATGPGAILARRDPLNTRNDPGWALTLGRYRGINHNPRFSISDGAKETELFADLDLADGRFHHLAATLHRTGASADARLYIDGTEADRHAIPQFGPITDTPLLMIGTGREATKDGPVDAPYLGLIEEVRVSGTARTAFDPVTGESDRQYRDRLAIFQSWLLPTPDNLQAALNRLAGSVSVPPSSTADAADPFVVDETTAQITTGSTLLRVLPRRLTPGQRITADGDRLPTEAQAVGTAADEPDFDPAWLCRHDDRPGLDFAGNDGNRQMQLTTRLALDALVDRLAALPGTEPGVLSVLRAYDPSGPGLYAVGRTLSLRHSTVPTAELGVHAHAVGFGWVTCTPDDQVYASQPPGDAFAITVTPADGTGLVAKHNATLDLDPPVAAVPGAMVRWSVTGAGPGSALVIPGNPAGTAVLQAQNAGDITVGVEVTRAGHTRGGHRTLRIGLPDDLLKNDQTIGRDGRIGATEADAAGTASKDFDPAYLQLRTDDLASPPAPVDYGADPHHRQMQPAAGAALDRLLAALGRTAPLTVASAYAPGAPGLAGQGRVLVLRDDRPATSAGPPPLTGAALAARAFAAGFDHITVQAPDGADGHGSIRVAVSAEEQLAVTVREQFAAPTDGAAAEMTEGESLTAAAGPRAGPVAACFHPDGSRFYLADRGSHRVVAYSLRTAGAAPGPGPAAPPLPAAPPVIAFAGSAVTGPLPVSIAFVGGRLFVAHERGRVVALDPGTLGAEPLATPDAVALATDGTRLYLTATDGTLHSYDPQTGTQKLNLPLPGTPGAIAVSPNGPLLAVLLDGARFCLVDRQAGHVHGPAIAVGAARVLCAAFTPDGGKLYVGVDTGAPGARRGAVLVYTADADTPRTLSGFPPGTTPVAMCQATDQRHLFIATAGSHPAAGRVHVLDATTDRLLPLPFAAADDCRALAASPAGATYPPCLLAVPEAGGALLLADQQPLAQDPPRPPELQLRQTIGPDQGIEIGWSVLPFGPGRAEPLVFDAPVTPVSGLAPGLVRLRAYCLRGSSVLPYQCEVRLREDLEAVGAVIGKGQYDLVLNILNWFQPIGVEFLTGRLRAHVRELAGAVGDADLLPAFTFPTYHTYDQPPFRGRRPERDHPP